MKIAIIGAGVAGATAALAMRTALPSADVTVYEAHPDPGGAVGSFVSLASNALHGLAALGVLDRVRDRGFPVERQRVWSRSGALAGDVPRGRVDENDLRSVTLMRADLVTELRLAALAAGAEIITGERLVAADRGRASFASGRTAEADLLVGADGLWSATRAALDPGAPSPRYSGLVVVSGRAPGAGVESGVFNLAFGRRGAFVHVREPGGEVWWQAQLHAPIEPAREEFTAEQWLDRARRAFRSEPVPTAILAGAHSVGRPSVNHALGPVTTWRDDHTVLIGDAVHPVGAGQGAAMAIEDAVVLAHHVARAGAAGIAGALAAFEQHRRPRVERLLKVSDDNREAKLAGPVRRAVERVAMPLFFRHFYLRATSWLYTEELPPLRPAPVA